MDYYFDKYLSPHDEYELDDNPLYNHLKERLANIVDIKNKGDLILNFWNVSRGIYNDYIEKAAEKILKEAEETNNHYTLGRCFFVLAWLRLDQDKYSESLVYFKRARENFLAEKQSEIYIRTLNGEATAYRYGGYFNKALDGYLTALELAEEVDNTKLIGILANNVGNLLNDLKQHDEALKYFEKAKFAQINSLVNIAIVYYNIGKTYRYLNNYSLAEQNLTEALELSLAENYKLTQAYCYLELGILRNLEGKSPEALGYLGDALQLANEVGIARVKAGTLLELGYMAKHRQDFEEALQYFEEALEIFRYIRAQNIELQVLQALFRVYGDLEDYESAYVVARTYHDLEEKIFNEEIINRLGALKVQQARKENLIFKELYERINTISKIGQAITSTLDIHEIGDMVYNNFKDLLEADNLAIGLYQENSQEILFKIYIKGGQHLPEFSYSSADGEHNLFKCVKENDLFVHNDLSEENTPFFERIAYPNSSEEERIHSVICCPLVARKKTLGLLTIQSQKRNTFTAHHIDIVKALAAYIAIALENEKLFSNLNRLAVIDPLTGLMNRRRIFECGQEEFVNHKKYCDQMSVIMIDIDKFKFINDSYGHFIGDMVLRHVASVLGGSLRETDILARLGGDEYLLILPYTNIREALAIGNRLCKDVHQRIYSDGEIKVQIKISLGLSEIKLDDGNISDTINRADLALYSAKEAGGNRVEVAN